MTNANARADMPAPQLQTPSGLPHEDVVNLSVAMTAILADFFAIYIKTKNFHWHMSGAHFRDYHRLLDEHGEQIFAATDPLAERIRKIGGTTIRSVGQISRIARVLDNDAPFVTPLDMLAELREDNTNMAARLRQVHVLCDEVNDVASASLLENWIDEAENRAWFLYETTRATEVALR